MKSRRPSRLAIAALCSALVTAAAWSAAQAAKPLPDVAPAPPGNRFT
jgi:hypothetical protein